MGRGTRTGIGRGEGRSRRRGRTGLEVGGTVVARGEGDMEMVVLVVCRLGSGEGVTSRLVEGEESMVDQGMVDMAGLEGEGGDGDLFG